MTGEQSLLPTPNVAPVAKTIPNGRNDFDFLSALGEIITAFDECGAPFHELTHEQAGFIAEYIDRANTRADSVHESVYYLHSRIPKWTAGKTFSQALPEWRLWEAITRFNAGAGYRACI